MKKLSEIVQLPVMEILNGHVAGKVKDIVMNPDTKEIIMVMDEGVFSDFHILQKQDVYGIGKDFIMIKTREAIQSSREIPELAKTLTEYYSVMGLLVITGGGNIVSRIKDVSIDEKEWQIIEVVLEDGKVYQRNQILSVSEKYVFVQDDEDGVDEPVSAEEDEEAYLIGMTVSEDVASEDGKFTVSKGTVLTKEIIEQAKANGAMASLIMNVE